MQSRFCSGLFPVFTKINFDSVENTVAFIKSRTNLEVSDFAIQLEYFGSMKYQLDEVTSVFFHGNEGSHQASASDSCVDVTAAYFISVSLERCFSDLKQKKVKLIQTPYLYAALVNLCFIPMFVIHVDWGRHLAPLMAMPTFVFLFSLRRKTSPWSMHLENERSCQKKTVVFCYNTGVDGRVCKFWCA